ncbi:reverse transcriptase [Gossypium australe]|uniref:Reverse transcriptase n=1 Tax=Gossypium australe TaxID=47621 RepID=A0A5B6WPT0_9ROSI|nr:reverse transcriptase [Gossypium australe]
MVLFSSNTPREQRQNFGDLLGMKVVEKLDNYLGLPLPIGKKKKVAFQEIINKLNSWTQRLLSFGGKEVFIKAVLQFIPILQFIPKYVLSIFLAPRGVIDDIQSKLSTA